MIKQKYVYDLLTRFLHAGIGSSALLLFLTAKLAGIFYENSSVRHNLWMLHIFLGFLLTGLIFMRVIWFFIGPKYARITNLIQLQNWKEIVETRKVKWKWGHHPFAALAYLGVYATFLYLIYSGQFLSRIQFDVGPISPQHFDDMNLFIAFLENHEIASCLIIIFMIVHMIALFWHQQNDGVSVFSSMKDGFQHKYINEDANEYGDPNEND